MKAKRPIPEISPLVRKWMPDATDNELKAATVCLRRYLAVAYRIFRRLEAEGKLPDVRDNPERYVRVDSSNNKGV